MTKKTGRESGPAIHWVIVFVYAALIWFVSDCTLPRPPGFYYRYQVDKILHFIEFAGFAILLCRAVRRTVEVSMLTVMLVAVAIAGGYALSDEIHQRYVIGRSSDWKDVASDVAGGCAGSVAWRRLTAMRRKSNGPEEEVEECSVT